MRSRGAIYVRESTEKQDWKAQLEQCKAYCKNQDIEIYKIYKDIASGSNNNRKEFLRLQEDMEDEKFNKVVVWELSRATRDFMAYKVMIMRMTDLGVELHSIQEGILTEGDIDVEFSNDIRALINSHERKRTAKRVKSRMEHIARSGRWTGGAPPYGYKLEKKMLVVDEEEAAKVKEIFNLYLRGEGIAELTRRFGFVDVKKIRRMLRNEVYIGKLKFRQQEVKGGGLTVNEDYEVIEGLHEGIVEEDLFYGVQELLGKKTRRKNPKGTYLFHNIRCYCGSPIYGKKDKKSKKGPYYSCLNQCGNGILYQKDLLEDVLEELKESIERFSCLEEVEINTQSQKRMYQREIRNLENQEGKLLEKYLEGKVPDRLYDNQMERYSNRREEIKKELLRLGRLEGNQKAREGNRKILLEYLEQIDSTKEMVTLEKVLGLIIEEIEFINHFRFILKVNFLD
ncbi:serine recombinase [Propionigenium maris DSM 9537]|uniref:Serine recombinase n=1 Tax=Propionigenium maris DSM 9537 TaxID=1123000 RepID=A0A9W6LQ86_9FUSO|nr:recombinase family protein [Propionigenium maris]GLI58310.1 serine recombinase [Propionigenium maris DSM 9537]